MSSSSYLLAIDQGTTSSRAIVFDLQGSICRVEQQEFTQHYPNDGWVEHDAEEIWTSTLTVVKKALQASSKDDLGDVSQQVAAIGITNQRETTVVWDKNSGKPIYNAIVWQDRRTADICKSLKTEMNEQDLQAKSGLLLDPYFSATKISWILDEVEGAREKAERGELAFGTIDTFLIWHLTAGKQFVTDITNASRTNLLNIHTKNWDDDLLALFRVPRAILPQVLESCDDFGVTDKSLLGVSIPISGVAGDQQAATVGQCCFEPGTIKSTYGTGCFMVLNTGEEAVISQNRLLTTIAYTIKGTTHYAVEGSIFVAGAGVQWLRDSIQVIDNAKDTMPLAEQLSDNGGVYFVPALTGLGAPHWDPQARGAIFGITRATTQAHFARATLEAVCYQTHDLVAAMREDGVNIERMRVDGGMVANNWLMQFLSDTLDMPVDRPQVLETTALGAAYLAGLQQGVYSSTQDLSQRWQIDSRFDPVMNATVRQKNLQGWANAIQRVLMPS